jgi:hypothetical protein
MKLSAKSVTLGLLIAIICVSCGRSDGTDSDSSSDNGSSQSNLAVNGVAGFGSQCPYGSVSAITPVTLAMYNGPTSLSQVNLAQDIEPLYISADCKNKIISARTADRRIDTNWYVLPDKTFFFTITGLNAELQSDGAGHSNCQTPLSVDFSGSIQCDENNPERDQATIQFTAQMWTGKTSPDTHHTPSLPAPTTLPSPAPDPSSSPSSHPSEGPHPWPWPWPFGSSTPTPTPTSGSRPMPTPTATPRPTPNRASELSVDMESFTPTGAQCSLPKNCYLSANTSIKQCQ